MCAFQRVSEFTGTVREHFVEEVKSELNRHTLVESAVREYWGGDTKDGNLENSVHKGRYSV